MAFDFTANNVQSSLNGAINNVVTTIRVFDGAAPYNDFPAPASGEIGVATISDSQYNPSVFEIITYTGVTDVAGSHDLTGVARGQEGTSNIAHLDGAFIFQGITKEALRNLIFDDIKVLGGITDIGQGLVAAASLAFVDGVGFYQPTTGTLAVTDGTTEIARFEDSTTALFLYTGDLNFGGGDMVDPDNLFFQDGSGTIHAIGPATSDAADDDIVIIRGGGASGATRGAYIELHGNEASGPGQLNLSSGGSADITLTSAGTIQVVDALAIDLGGGDLTNMAGIYFNDAGAGTHIIAVQTPDAGDDNILQISGGGADHIGVAAGAYIELHGNEASGPGELNLFAGSTGLINANSNINMQGNDILGVEDFTFQDAGTHVIQCATSDGFDDNALEIRGGGGAGSGRGAVLAFHGNEGPGTGSVTILTGNVAGGTLTFLCAHADSPVIMQPGSNSYFEISAGLGLDMDDRVIISADLTAASNRLKQDKSMTFESPTSSEDLTFFFIDHAITVAQVRAVLPKGASTPTVTYQLKHHTDRNDAGNALTTSGAVTSTTIGTDATLSDATIPADSWIWLETTAQGGTVPEMTIYLEYTDD